MTTILCIKKNNDLIIASDGQISAGNSVCVKSTAKKIRFLGKKKEVLAGFAGSVSDALTLFDLLDQKINEYEDLKRAVHELMKSWRTDKYIRHLEAEMIVADKNYMFTLSGGGNIIEPDSNILATGSGGFYALSSAIALSENTNLSALDIVKKSMKIASDICLFTNNNLTIESINITQKNPSLEKSTEEKKEKKKKSS